jgi:hypothetical protein
VAGKYHALQQLQSHCHWSGEGSSSSSDGELFTAVSGMVAEIRSFFWVSL